MKSDELRKITEYISLWGWQILAIIFLCSSFIMLALPRNLMGFVFGLTFFFIFIFCEYKSLKRKQEFYEKLS